MGNIGGELPPQFLPLLLLGDVHQHQDRSRRLPVLPYRVGQQLAAPPIHLEHLSAPVPLQYLVHRLTEVLLPVKEECVDLSHWLLRPQQAQRTRVVGQDTALPVQKQEALRHVLCQSGKLRLLLLELPHLLLDGVILPLDPGEERRQLVIGITVLWMFQIQLGNRPDDAPGQP